MRKRHLIVRLGLTISGALGLWGCTSADVGSGEDYSTEIPATENWDRDVLSTDLEFDLGTHRATARIAVDGASAQGASFEIGDLTIYDVFDAAGEPLQHRAVDGRLDVGIPAEGVSELSVTYRYRDRTELEGSLPTGLTFLWPYFCGNLFPCKSDPADGLQLSMQLSAIPGGQAVYPELIGADAPSYMLAWAVGDYTQLELGTTAAGTTVSVYYLPGEEQTARDGTANLAPAFDWLERTYGPYTFGSDVASVSAHWGGGAYGGMEHHPYWHVSAGSMGDEITHVHEAVHGWYGNGIRIACWEDLTLSEGTTTYLTARAIEAVAGPEAGAEVWAGYDRDLDWVVAHDDRLALLETCDQIDVITDLWNLVPYMKGAFFFRAVEAEIGREALDGVLASFYQERHGTAARVQDLLDAIAADTGFDPTELANGWLRSMGRPDR